MNASMVSIHSKDENDFLRKHLDDGKEYFLGGKLEERSAVLKWSDGSSFNFSSQIRETRELMILGAKRLTIHPDGSWNLNFVSGWSNFIAAQICQKYINLTFENYKIVKANKFLAMGFEVSKNYEEIHEILIGNLGCEQKWFKYGNKCYFAENSKKLNRSTIIEYCASLKAEIISIHSPDENSFISKQLPQSDWYWTGGRDIYGSRIDWEDNSLTNFEKRWYSFSGKNDFKILLMNNYGDWWWTDYEAGDRYYTICQKKVSIVTAKMAGLGWITNAIGKAIL
ncbi:C-type lectin domain family 4: member b2-like protein [Leptotrombidium deliense]|uniref:C-type lectin domain family 4: member b2-like protein n=1 Tax=Leptotrombidium deliense TaxID=299467 RepID=A0A443S101_9ACAR|nr:C-type lectin domain family 4: member b2-like protein [Leptotrombidium deliense]